MNIRIASAADVSRIAEIFVFNNRINYFPIFGDESYSFGELQVLTVAGELTPERLGSIFVYDDGIVRGFVELCGEEIKRLYVDPFFQGRGIGSVLIEFAAERGCRCLWALEKNEGAIRFYERHGFARTGERKHEEGTAEYLIKLSRN